MFGYIQAIDGEKVRTVNKGYKYITIHTGSKEFVNHLQIIITSYSLLTSRYEIRALLGLTYEPVTNLILI